ncbi:DUF6894 family protein [Methylobacterium iners]|uniref:DUF6894 domain-containing protein n=1 Tax=Methylobacterium iners TaxID=418707 RepID=A0ABQ4RZH8_9HYPH|nr:hypothetical protein [Methylobacterium iners]GJD95028.1 hypothetical protein OCOJLMKI_2237 [Methylobacterium iners]
MPRYFIDTSDGKFEARDEEGLDLPSIEAARREVVTVLRQMGSHSLDGDVRSQITCSVRDEAGTVLFEAVLVLSQFWMVRPPSIPRRV